MDHEPKQVSLADYVEWMAKRAVEPHRPGPRTPEEIVAALRRRRATYVDSHIQHAVSYDAGPDRLCQEAADLIEEMAGTAKPSQDR